VQHPWFENDCAFADIVLPVSTMMECDDIATDNNGGQFALFFKEDSLIDPLHESVSDMSCCVRIARKLEEFGGVYTGLVGKLTRNRTLEESFEQCFEKSGIPDEDFTYEDLKNQGFWASPIEEGWEDQPAGLARFHEDPERYPLSTPTGKIEYYATGLAEHFPDDKIRAPYPQWIEETDEHQERQSSERAESYPYLLMSNHPHWRVHAQLDDVPWFREIETCKIKGPDGYAYEPVWINPLDAEREGIKQGDVVGLFNERGTVLGAARVTERIRSGALYQDHGARIDSIVPGKGGLERAGANNLICPSPTTSKNAVGEVTNGFLTGIKKVDVFELAKQYPEQFGRKFDFEIGLIPTSYIVEEG
jgi:trimethylamine-N-oxide reductase (cytochrome c)